MAALTILVSAGGLAQEIPQIPSGTRLVFFDWGKHEISRDATAILDGVITEFRQTSGMKIQLVGHSDRSGPAWVNRRAARHRAEAVRDHLVGRGVPPRLIHVLAAGESHPIIPTEDGVREAQNRRVEIQFIHQM